MKLGISSSSTTEVFLPSKILPESTAAMVRGNVESLFPLMVIRSISSGAIAAIADALDSTASANAIALPNLDTLLTFLINLPFNTLNTNDNGSYMIYIIVFLSTKNSKNKIYLTKMLMN